VPSCTSSQCCIAHPQKHSGRQHCLSIGRTSKYTILHTHMEQERAWLYQQLAYQEYARAQTGREHPNMSTTFMGRCSPIQYCTAHRENKRATVYYSLAYQE